MLSGFLTLKKCFHIPKGLLGGANAFHFLTFVVGLATLVVNVENNLNQNNNNLNGININANRQTNNNANANNNAMNMIEVTHPIYRARLKGGG